MAVDLAEAASGRRRSAVSTAASPAGGNTLRMAARAPTGSEVVSCCPSDPEDASISAAIRRGQEIHRRDAGTALARWGLISSASGVLLVVILGVLASCSACRREGLLWVAIVLTALLVGAVWSWRPSCAGHYTMLRLRRGTSRARPKPPPCPSPTSPVRAGLRAHRWDPRGHARSTCGLNGPRGCLEYGPGRPAAVGPGSTGGRDRDLGRLSAWARLAAAWRDPQLRVVGNHQEGRLTGFISAPYARGVHG